MLLLGKVISSLVSDDATNMNRISVRIEPFSKGLEDFNEDPGIIIRPLINNGNTFENFIADELLYLWTEDPTFNEVYYIGKVNSATDYDSLMSNIDTLNTTLETHGADTLSKTIRQYALTNKRLKITAIGDQLLIMSEEDNLTLLANKTTGACFYINGESVSILMGQNHIIVKDSMIVLESGKSSPTDTDNARIEMNANGDVKVYASTTGLMSIISKMIVLSGDNINIGRPGGTLGYVVTTPNPGITADIKGMSLRSSDSVKVG